MVDCLGFFRANGTAYLVMEHVDGMSLAALLRQREAKGLPLDENELRSIVVPLLDTLSRLHKADVLHRDIKPSNILVRQASGQPVLIDFGAAKQQAAVFSKSVAPFTEGYAALEQVGEGDLGPLDGRLRDRGRDVENCGREPTTVGSAQSDKSGGARIGGIVGRARSATVGG